MKPLGYLKSKPLISLKSRYQTFVILLTFVFGGNSFKKRETTTAVSVLTGGTQAPRLMRCSYEIPFPWDPCNLQIFSHRSHETVLSSGANKMWHLDRYDSRILLIRRRAKWV